MIDKLGIGIMTSINLKDRYMACKNTWVLDFDNIFLFGGDSEDDNLIRLKNVGEDYNSCFLKQQLGLKYIYEKNDELDWYCMVGCDTILYKNNIIEELNKFNRDEDLFLGQSNNHLIVNNTNILAVAGGGGFFISNSLMRKIYPKILEFNDTWKNLSDSNKLPVPYAIADIAIAYMIKLYFNIDSIHISGMFSQNPSKYIKSNNYCFLNDNDINRLNSPLSYHYIKPIEMNEIYKKYKKI